MKWMSWKKWVSRSAAVLMSIALALSTCGATAYAYERINTDKQASLTAVLAPQETGAIEGVRFRLYKVADVSDAVKFHATEQFADAAVSFNDVESAGEWADIATTLSAYADANRLSADFTENTGADGKVSFPGLTVGLYLLVGDTAVAGEYSYSPTPTVVMLPTLSDNDTWEYDSTVNVKASQTLLTKYQNVTVKKIWKDGERSGHPDSVTMQLLQNGKVQETVTLNAANNWTYTWSDLKSSYESDGKTGVYTYSVNEKNVPSGYTASVSRNGDSFTVTNTYRNQTVKPADKTLPQTGALNWPIPVLTIVGLLLMGTGWYMVNRKKED